MEAAELRELNRAPALRRFVSARRLLSVPLAAAAAVALLGVVFALIAGTLDRENEQARPAPKVSVDRVAAGLGPLATGFGSVWTYDPVRNELLRIDPGTRRVVARMWAGGENVLAAGAGAVWALGGDLANAGDLSTVRLQRIDPRSNRAATPIELGVADDLRHGRRPLRPARLQVDGDAVWVIGYGGLLRIDTERNAPGRFIALSGTPERNGDRRRDRMEPDPGLRALRTIDTRSGRVTHERQLGTLLDTTLVGGHGVLLVRSAADRLTRLDERSGRVLWTTRLGARMDMVHIGEQNTIWAHRADGLLVSLDADSGRRTGQLQLPEPGAAGIADVGRELWIATPTGRIIIVKR